MGKVVKDLDRLIIEADFDLESFEREVDLWISKIQTAMDLYDSGSCEKADKLGKEGNKHCDNVQEMVRPLYEEMLKIGYTETELIE